MWYIYFTFCFDGFFVFFFFQAEDGIRDTSVTGVQTCALPISGPAFPDSLFLATAPTCCHGSLIRIAAFTPTGTRGEKIKGRSEERRVGKECRSRWSP